MAAQYDLLIVGAGPGGLAAAIAARALHLRAVVLDAGPRPGGQLLVNDTPILDCPGLDVATGSELAVRLQEHLERLGGEVRVDARVERIDVDAGVVELAGERLTGTAVLLATGASRRRLGVPGEADLPGRGLSPAARRFGPAFAGRPVVVVGGGDVALEEAALLARLCPRVTLVHRGSKLRARPDFRAAVAAEPRIDLLLETQLVAIRGGAEVEGVVLAGPAGEHRVEAAAVVVCAGMAPCSGLVLGQVATDEAGFVRVDARQRTSAPRLYAVGDVCAGAWWTVSAAIGQAGIAVKDFERRLSADEFSALLAPGPTFAPVSWEA
ncbi:NAD(P)/FAD-dependent oxidoreductase [Nannocystis radixulma]|uniref:FAD-dependent oxidoreductase n=1 Tax=Nannocystis radixulma TaxID=2995305 RepID=A0ABT5B2U9_9BACT|nr:FAD-dependent oxidoreductase [Nannocystis radixulma]MDC0668426.1 FAD-dependent oxidoreductase [Nannocystis radixulma]